MLLLLDALREAGHTSILLARDGAPLLHLASSAGFEVGAADAKTIWKCSGRVEIVHAHDARAHTMAAIASRRRFVVSRRVAFPVKRSLASVWKYQRATRYLAVSKFVERELLSAGIPGSKVDIVYDGVEVLQSLAPWSPENPAVSVASADPQKGSDLVEQAAKASGIETIFSTDLASDLKKASLFVYISRSEGLGSAALLGMNYGVPVIASRTGGLAEVFTDGVSGIFVQNEVGDIARAMRRVIGSRAVAERLIEEGRKRIAEQFTKDHLLQATLSSYGKALDS